MSGSDGCARAASGHAAALPSSVMNSRRFTERCLPCFEAEDSTPADLLHCGIPKEPLSAVGHERQIDRLATWAALPLRPRKRVGHQDANPSLRAKTGREQTQQCTCAAKPNYSI